MSDNFILFAHDDCNVPEGNLSALSSRWNIIPVNSPYGLRKSTIILFRLSDVPIRLDFATLK
jgi:hypothetical protein